jgi:hypothetical protein
LELFVEGQGYSNYAVGCTPESSRKSPATLSG